MTYETSSLEKNSISHCFVCVKHVIHLDTVDAERRNTKKRFFHLLERYFSHNQNLHVSHTSVTQPVTDTKKNCVGDDFPICEDCFELVESFCKLYNEVRKLELKLDERIWKLKKIMVCAGNVPSRMTSLQEYYSQKDSLVADNKFWRSRKRIIQKCTSKLHNGFPRVSLSKSRLCPHLTNIGSSVHQKGDVPNDNASGEVDTSSSSLAQITESSAVSTSRFQPNDQPGQQGLDKQLTLEAGSEIPDGENFEPSTGPVLSDPTPNSAQIHPVTLKVEADWYVNVESHMESHASEMNPWDANESDENIRSHIDNVSDHSGPSEEEHIETDIKGFNIKPELLESSESSTEDEIDDGEEMNRNEPQKRQKRRITVKSTSTAEGVSQLGKGKKKNQFRCLLCSQAFHDAKQIIDHHLRIHCKKLDRKFTSSEPDNKLLENMPFSNMPGIETTIIEQQLANPSAKLAQLVPEILKNSMYPCMVPMCPELFSLPRELEIHSKLHGDFKCNFCDVVEGFAPDVALHELNKHSTQIKGKMKNSQNSGETDLNCEMKGIKKCSRSKFTCPRCPNEYFSQKNFLDHHLEEHLDIPLNRLKCTICQHIFPSHNSPFLKPSIKYHHRSNHDLTGVDDPTTVKRCDQCPAFFLTFELLAAHNKRVHKNPARRCKDCGRSFSNRNKYTRHRIKMHNAQLNFKCDREGCEKKKFETELELFHHNTFNHKGMHPTLACDQCGKTFLGQRLLRAHVLAAHERVKKPPTVKSRKYVCEQCGKAFKEKCILEQHYLSHSGPKTWDFTCSECSKKCLTKQKLEEHMRTHTKQKPFVCQHCGVKYAHRHNLRIHVNNKHGDIAKDIPRAFDRSNLSSKKGNKCKK